MKVGFSVADITPELGIYLTGYGIPERLATGVHSPLNATAMVMQDGEKTAVVIGLDWCYIKQALTDEICSLISEKAGIPVKNILISCTHTHSAPHTSLMRSLGRISVDPEFKGWEYAKKSVPVIVEAVIKAKENMREVVACFAEGKTETGVSRRGMNKNGEVAGFIADPDAMYDDNMTAVRFKDAATMEDFGILIHCSAHNTAMGSANREISSDWCGVMKKRVGQYYKVPVLFVNGAIGDVGPRTNYWVSTDSYAGYSAGVGDGPSSVEEVGYRAASDALKLLQNMRDFRSDLPLRMNTVTIEIPQEIQMPEDEAKRVFEMYHSDLGNESEPPLEYQFAKNALEAWSEPPQPIFSFEQTVLAFGPLAFVPFPFEMFSVFSLRLRKYGPCQYTLLCSNVNDSNAYFPDRSAIASGGYEITSRRWIRPYVLKPEAGDLAISQTLDSLNRMK